MRISIPTVATMLVTLLALPDARAAGNPNARVLDYQTPAAAPAPATASAPVAPAAPAPVAVPHSVPGNPNPGSFDPPVPVPPPSAEPVLQPAPGVIVVPMPVPEAGAVPTTNPAPAAPAAPMVVAPVVEMTGPAAGPTERIAMANAALDQSGERITISLNDVPLTDVVNMFIRISGANIIASPTNLLGRVTVSLKDVEWKAALSEILSIHGLALNQSSPDSNVYSISPPRPQAEMPLFAQSFSLSYIRAESISNGVAMLIKPNGTLLVASGDRISVLATSKQVKDVGDLIKSLDIIIAQVYIEAKFVELNDQAIKDLGIDWRALEGYTTTLSAPALKYDRTESLRDKEQNVNATWKDNSLQSLTRNNDTLESTSVKTVPSTGLSGSTTASKLDTKDALGYTAGSGMSLTGHRFDTALYDPNTGATTPTQLTPHRELEQIRSVSAVLSAEDLALTLSALKQNVGAEIITNPKLVVSSGQKATIHVGQKQPNIVRKTNSTQAGTAEVTYEYGDPAWIDIGAKVDVTPTVNTESNITVRIEPQLDRQIGTIEPTPGLAYPVLSSSHVTSEFVLQSGQTVAIGGLTSTEDREEVNKIPFLGDIPILGKYLFSHTHTKKDQSETIIFVSVALTRPELSNEETGIPSQSYLMRSRFEGSLKGRLKLRDRNAPPPRPETNSVPNTAGAAKTATLSSTAAAK